MPRPRSKTQAQRRPKVRVRKGPAAAKLVEEAEATSQAGFGHRSKTFSFLFPPLPHKSPQRGPLGVRPGTQERVASFARHVVMGMSPPLEPVSVYQRVGFFPSFHWDSSSVPRRLVSVSVRFRPRFRFDIWDGIGSGPIPSHVPAWHFDVLFAENSL